MINKFYHDDCFNIIPKIKDNSIDLLFTSIPDLAELDVELPEYIQFIDEFVNIISPKISEKGFAVMCQTDRKIGGSVYPKHVDIIQAYQKYGYKLKDYKIIIKNNVELKDMYMFNYQHCLIFTKKGTIKNRKGDWLRGTLLYQVEKGPGKFYIWNKEFVKFIIEGLSVKDNLIVDPFAGSGIVPYVAKLLERNYIGVELDEYTYNNSFFRPNTLFE